MLVSRGINEERIEDRIDLDSRGNTGHSQRLGLKEISNVRLTPEVVELSVHRLLKRHTCSLYRFAGGGSSATNLSETVSSSNWK